MSQHLSVKFVKKGGTMMFQTSLMKEQYTLLTRSMAEGEILEVLFEKHNPTNTKAQLAKLHVCIKEIADEQGDSPANVKKEVKRQSGMSFKDDAGKEQFKSFADCSKKELSNVIEVVIQIGVFLGITFENPLED